MEITNWRAIVDNRSDLPSRIDLSRLVSAQEFGKVYEAWKQHYPDLTAEEIAHIAGVHVPTTQAYISQLNATKGNVADAKMRLSLYQERSRLRRALSKSHPAPEVLAELLAIDAKLTKEIDRLRIGRRAPRKTLVETLHEKLAEAEWIASGIDG